MAGIRVVSRDYTILKEVERWRIITGKQIGKIAGFSSQRACDKRLAKLQKIDLLEREKILYGLPGFYHLTPKGKALLGIRNRKESIRIDQIHHDMTVLDTAIFFHYRYDIPYENMVSEKELHKKDGFGNRRHCPDFIFTKDERNYCVEIELSLKSKARFEKNVVDNFKNYERQFWIIPDLHSKIYQFLKEMNSKYPNIKVLERTEIQIDEY
ncbi:hypothetical protein WGC32_00845 [Zongyangia sp. HA2173]|uniref:hypothetical protein n=1 Tax=Zongyangia sp. HA2173 TaxID=3133035 RepID=UPI00316AB1C5